MMDEQSKFKEALASVTIRAEENGGKLSAEEAKELLKDMEFNDRADEYDLCISGL